MNISSIVNDSSLTNKLQGLYKYLDEKSEAINSVFDNINSELQREYNNIVCTNSKITIKLNDDDIIDNEINNVNNIISSCINSSDIDNKDIFRYVFKTIRGNDLKISITKTR